MLFTVVAEELRSRPGPPKSQGYPTGARTSTVSLLGRSPARGGAKAEITGLANTLLRTESGGKCQTSHFLTAAVSCWGFPLPKPGQTAASGKPGNCSWPRPASFRCRGTQQSRKRSEAPVRVFPWLSNMCICWYYIAFSIWGQGETKQSLLL